MQHFPLFQNRREFIRDAFCGFGSLALASMLEPKTSFAAGEVGGPRAGSLQCPQAGRAKAVIFLFMAGGPSHLETFDPKPLLEELNGQPRPRQFGEAKYQFIKKDARLLASRRKFTRFGRSGIEVSDLFPHLGRSVDDLAIIRSCYGDRVVHSAAQYEIFSGRVVPGFPSMGSWIVYGLGSESECMPSYVVMPDPNGALEAGAPMYSNGFLPASYQPTLLRPGKKPIFNLGLPEGVSLARRQRTVALIRELNRASLEREDDELKARIDSYELAFRMQVEAPQVFDLSHETRDTLELYGIGAEPTDDYGRRCLLARRLVEKGVRFVCVVSGGGDSQQQWDAHQDIEENHRRMAAKTDQPMAALLTDLKRRGLLDSTLVLWGGEFGRSPEAEGGRGRDHHNLGFTMWMAGGGIRGGQVVGATDEIGLKAIERPCHFRDIHATILHQLGLDQNELTYLHSGRKERLTLIQGDVIREIV